jgi:putative ABC transport system permease protein
MRKVTLRSVWEHKRRLLSTVLAIVLGVGFMAGTLVFADTLDRVFDDLFADVNEDVDVQVQGEKLFDGGFGGGPDARQDLDLALVDTVAEVEGVERVAPFIQVLGFGATNRVIGPDGEALGSTNGPPTLFESWITDDVLNPYELAEGRAPERPEELALNVAAAEDGAISVGDEVTVVSQFGESTHEVVGTFRFGEADSAAGAVSVDFTFEEAQRLAGLDGTAQTFLVAGDGAVDDTTLAARIEDVLPDGTEALTGEEAAEQTASGIQEGFAFFRILLLVFGAIAVIVGAFIIFNTFSILVAQRTRELALLRAIGASRRQVLGSVLAEATIVGTFSAVLGLGAGVGLATGVTALLDAAGSDLPTSGLVLAPRTVAIAFAIGLGVTLAASVLPALSATRVPPIAALREVAIDRSSTSRVRAGLGLLLLTGAAIGLSTAWWYDGDVERTVGVGAFLLIVGAIVFGPVVSEPTVRLLASGLPRLKGITGQLATENAARNPKRTSATASALMIGVALVGFITIFAASARDSVRDEVARGFTGDLIVQGEGGFGPPPGFPPTVLDEVEAVDGVEAASPVGFLQAQLTYPNGDRPTTFVSALDPATLTDVFAPRMAEGDIAELSDDGIVVDTGIAEDEGLGIGDVVTLTGPTGRSRELVIEMVSDDLTVIGFWAVSMPTYSELVTNRQFVQVIVSVEDGAGIGRVQRSIEAVVEDLPGMAVLDREGFVGDLAAQITSFLNLVNGLLLLSIVIAMIGVANTLSLSIHERTRELGLLRAVGMSRSQLRSSVRWEAVIISLVGTLVGLGVGLLASWALVTALGDFGLSTFTVPAIGLASVVVVAALLGVLASVRPARRAAKLQVLDAIGTE